MECCYGLMVVEPETKTALDNASAVDVPKCSHDHKSWHSGKFILDSSSEAVNSLLDSVGGKMVFDLFFEDEEPASLADGTAALKEISPFLSGMPMQTNLLAGRVLKSLHLEPQYGKKKSSSPLSYESRIGAFKDKRATSWQPARCNFFQWRGNASFPLSELPTWFNRR